LLPSFQVMIKPAGARCNLSCEYCFYREKKKLYPSKPLIMSDEVLESFVKQYIQSQRTPEVTFSWQGGEPLLMGIDFYRRALAFQKRYRKPGMVCRNTIQTNGTLINDDWCRFFRDHHFLVGISLDGPEEFHDRYRKDEAGRGSFNAVVKAVRSLLRFDVDYNILVAVTSANAPYPRQVYSFFHDTLEARYLQFIPIVNPEPQGSGRVSSASVSPIEWGHFLMEIFKEWVRQDVGSRYIINFESILARWLERSDGLCIFNRTCGLAVALEHTGDVYSCDHYVQPAHLLGNLLKTPLVEMIMSQRQQEFGLNKTTSLPANCRGCKYLFACNGECPKNRFLLKNHERSGENYLCEGYRFFFQFAAPYLVFIKYLLENDKPASDIMQALAQSKKILDK
jgi:uncharacterized protein